MGQRSRVETPEEQLKARLWLLKETPWRSDRSGWESLLCLLRQWSEPFELMPQGSNNTLYDRILQLHAALPTPDRRVMELVWLARGRWREAVNYWKQTGDDSRMTEFSERFQRWVATEDSVLTTSVLLELGRQLLRPGRSNASLFLSQVPAGLLRAVYGE